VSYHLRTPTRLRLCARIRLPQCHPSAMAFQFLRPEALKPFDGFAPGREDLVPQ
jgi:hypothetical protein